MYATSGLPADEVARGRAVFDLMRTQLMGGQFLDVLEAFARGPEDAALGDLLDAIAHEARVGVPLALV